MAMGTGLGSSAQHGKHGMVKTTNRQTLNMTREEELQANKPKKFWTMHPSLP
jgi:hypothetical protein